MTQVKSPASGVHKRTVGALLRCGKGEETPGERFLMESFVAIDIGAKRRARKQGEQECDRNGP